MKLDTKSEPRQTPRMKNIFAIIVAAAVLLTTASCTDNSESATPNIIFIMADDMGYGDLGCYGQTTIQTPNIDQMAREGTRFTDCYAGSTVCAPSRSVLMTGLHTGHTTVRGNFGKYGVTGLAGGNGRVPLEKDDVTVAEVLKTAGYKTGISGKWGLGEPKTSGHPNDQGFDEWFGYLNQRRAHSYYPDFIWKNKEKFELPENRNGKEGTYTHDLFTDFALDFLDRHEKERFFLYLPYTVPHSRYEIPDTAPYSQENWTDDEKVHAAMITRLDRDVGKLFQRLKDLDIDEQTIVFFCSDNGAAERWEKRFDSSGALRGRKRDMYEGGLRTPMIVRWPEVVSANRTSNVPWYFADVLPTLAELGNAAPTPNLDGISIAPTLLGKPQELSSRYMYWEFFEGGFQQAVRKGNWKAIRTSIGKPIELYNLETDTSENRDIASRHPQVVTEMESILQSARSPSLNWPVESLD